MSTNDKTNCMIQSVAGLGSYFTYLSEPTIMNSCLQNINKAEKIAEINQKGGEAYGSQSMFQPVTSCSGCQNKRELGQLMHLFMLMGKVWFRLGWCKP